MKWATVIRTAPRPTSYIEGTIDSLAKAGWNDPIIWSEPGAAIPDVVRGPRVIVNHQRLGPHFTFRAAMNGIVELFPDADAYGIFEDDIQITRGLRCHLETVDLWPSDNVGVLSLYTAGANAGEIPGWHQCSRIPERAIGALAFIFPRRAARLFVSTPPASRNWNQADYWVGYWCKLMKLEYWMHSPSFVLHVGVESSISTRSIDRFRQCKEFVEDMRTDKLTFRS